MALAFAARYAKRVNAFGLVDTTAWYGPDAPRQFQVKRWFSERFRKDDPEAVRSVMASFIGNDVQAYAASGWTIGTPGLARLLR